MLSKRSGDAVAGALAGLTPTVEQPVMPPHTFLLKPTSMLLFVVMNNANIAAQPEFAAHPKVRPDQPANRCFPDMQVRLEGRIPGLCLGLNQTQLADCLYVVDRCTRWAAKLNHLTARWS